MKTNSRISSIEALESRIAPAAIVGNTLNFKDIDGDKVTIIFTKGHINSSDFTFNNAFSTTGPQQLETISLDNTFANTDIITLVKGEPGGDGHVAIGFIDAPGVALDAVLVHGDVGQISAGFVKLLDIASAGVYGVATQASGSPSLDSVITGKLGTLIVSHNLENAEISAGSISLALVGSMDGGSSISSSTGAVGPVSVGGSVSGGSSITGHTGVGLVTIGADFRGDITATTGNITGVKIRGEDEGGITATTGNVGPVSIGTTFSDQITAPAGTIGAIKVGGPFSGTVSGDLGVGPVSIGETFTGTITSTAGKIGTLKFGGSDDNGKVSGDTGVGLVLVAGDVKSGASITSSAGPVGTVKIGGSLTEASDITGESVGPVTIAHDLRGHITSTDGNIGTVRVGAQIYDGSIESQADIGSIIVGGTVRDATILAGAISGTITNTGAVSIGTVVVGGNWIGSNLSAGVAEGASDDGYGNANDVAVSSSAKVARIIIDGVVSGDPPTPHFGFDAESIGLFLIGGEKVPFNPANGVADGVYALSLPTGNVDVIIAP